MPFFRPFWSLLLYLKFIKLHLTKSTFLSLLFLKFMHKLHKTMNGLDMLQNKCWAYEKLNCKKNKLIKFYIGNKERNFRKKKSNLPHIGGKLFHCFGRHLLVLQINQFANNCRRTHWNSWTKTMGHKQWISRIFNYLLYCLFRLLQIYQRRNWSELICDSIFIELVHYFFLNGKILRL